MKPIGKRMVIVSAGVVMNIILAVIGFTLLFGYGFRAPPAVVGGIAPGSPAQRAGMQVGDTILTFDGKPQYDFTKIMLSAILASEKTAVPIVVRHPEGTEQTLTVTAERRASDSKSFLALGISGPSELIGLDPAKQEKDDTFNAATMPPSLGLIHPGDIITAINGEPVKDPVTDYYLLDRAAQSSFGKPIQLTIKGLDGNIRNVETEPMVLQPFGDTPLSFLGMEPRATVDAILPDSVACQSTETRRCGSVHQGSGDAGSEIKSIQRGSAQSVQRRRPGRAGGDRDGAARWKSGKHRPDAADQERRRRSDRPGHRARI